ncbi:hypothetical protein GCM10010519_30600 [Streptomyces lactacystinicus]
MSTAQLQALLDRAYRNEEAWESGFRKNVPTYDPARYPDQLADDEHMDDWDETDTSRAFDSRDLLFKVTAELEAIIAEMEHTPGGQPLISAEDFTLLSHPGRGGSTAPRGPRSTAR